MNSINTNMSALTAQANMQKQSREMESAMERLSSGLRINSAADDAAGSAIASKMESQIRSLDVAVRNANDAISLTQTAEGALGEVENILQRMRELSVQAGNSTLNTGDRSQIQNEINQLAAEIDSIASKSNFNGVDLLNGANDKVTMQIGVDASDSFDILLQKTDVSSLGVGNSGTASSSATLTSGRITVVGTTDILTSDVKINGKDWTASDFDVDATSIDGTSTDLSGALASNSLQATGIAQKINENSGVHGVTATAFNEITTSTSNYSGALVTINGTIITASGSKEIFIDKVNDTVVGVTAELLSDGKIKFSNNDGASFDFGGDAAAVLGIAEDIYIGADAYITDDLSLTSDAAVFAMGAGSDITITHDGGTGGTLASAGAFIIDGGDNITLDQGDDKHVVFAQAGVDYLAIGQGTAAIANILDTAGATDIDTFTCTTFQATKYIILVEDVTNANYMTTEILLLGDENGASDAAPYLTQYAVVFNDHELGVFAATGSGDTVTLTYDPTDDGVSGDDNHKVRVVAQRIASI